MNLEPLLGQRPVPFEDLFLLRQPRATNLLLIRHGQAGYPEGYVRPAGSLYDPPLTEQGRAQAQRLAQRLRQLDIHRIYSSHLRRALETAQPIAQDHGLSIQVREHLREISFTLPQGTLGPNDQPPSPEERVRLMNQLMRQGFRWDAFSTTEDRLAFRLRIAKAMDEVVRDNEGKTVAIVFHGGAINAYVSHLLESPRDMLFATFNASVSLVRALDSERAVIFLNDISHLLDPAQ